MSRIKYDVKYLQLFVYFSSRHWIAVFNLVYQRSVQNHVTYLIKNFIHTKGKFIPGPSIPKLVTGGTTKYVVMDVFYPNFNQQRSLKLILNDN